MKAKEVLNLLRITRQTLTKYVKEGIIKVTTLPNGHYDYHEESVYSFLNKDIDRKIVIYGRVSTNKQKKDLDNQIEMLKKYCFGKGYQITEIYKDVASGINFEKRKQFFELLDEILNNKIKIVIISYRDRLSRVGFSFFEQLFNRFGTSIEVVSEVGDYKLDSEEVFEEIVSLLHCFSMKLYSKRKKNGNIEIEEKNENG
jgi:putative resolvase